MRTYLIEVPLVSEVLATLFAILHLVRLWHFSGIRNRPPSVTRAQQAERKALLDRRCVPRACGDRPTAVPNCARSDWFVQIN